MIDGLFDLHSHVLPDVDDGPRGLAQALSLVRLYEGDEVGTVVATPHVHPEYLQTLERREDAFLRLQTAIKREGLELELVLGAEIDADEAMALSDEALVDCCFGPGRVALLEFPWVSRWPAELPEAAERARGLGLSVVVAHPERIDVWSHDLNLIADLRRDGAAIQITAGAILGAFGRREQSLADTLLGEGLVDLVASDAHGEHRPPCMSAARDRIARDYGEELARQLVVQAPRRIFEHGLEPAEPAR